MDQANSLTSFCGHSWGGVICYAWLVARLAGNWGNICGPEYLVTASTFMNLYGKTSARFAFFSLFSVFSGNYFSTFKMSLSFRKGGEAMLWVDIVSQHHDWHKAHSQGRGTLRKPSTESCQNDRRRITERLSENRQHLAAASWVAALKSLSQTTSWPCAVSFLYADLRLLL